MCHFKEIKIWFLDIIWPPPFPAPSPVWQTNPAYGKHFILKHMFEMFRWLNKWNNPCQGPNNWKQTNKSHKIDNEISAAGVFGEKQIYKTPWFFLWEVMFYEIPPKSRFFKNVFQVLFKNVFFKCLFSCCLNVFWTC